MVAYNHRASVMIVVISLLLASVCYGIDTKVEKTTTTSSSKTPTISEDSAKKDSSSEPEETTTSSRFFPVEQLHEVIRKERVETLLEIDKERKATLIYLTLERRAVVEELKTELNRITELLKSERRATMVEMEATGNRIVENVILKSERLIDHFFVRVLQLAMIIMTFIILGFFIFRIIAKRKSQS